MKLSRESKALKKLLLILYFQISTDNLHLQMWPTTASAYESYLMMRSVNTTSLPVWGMGHSLCYTAIVQDGLLQWGGWTVCEPERIQIGGYWGHALSRQNFYDSKIHWSAYMHKQVCSSVCDWNPRLLSLKWQASSVNVNLGIDLWIQVSTIIITV